MSNQENFSGFTPASLQLVKTLDFAVCNLIVRAENARIVVDCNYHFQIEGRPLDMVSSALGSWDVCQTHLTDEVIPQL